MVNLHQRLSWVNETEASTWKEWPNVLWADKTIFFTSGRKVFVRSKPGERLNDEFVVPTVKNRGGILLCGGVLL